MRTLRDTATLVALILLALTVRVDVRGPSSIDVGTPAHAATGQTPVREVELKPLPEADAQAVIETVRSFVRPAMLGQSALALPGLAAIPQGEGRQLVWELDGQRIVIVLSEDEPIAPRSPSADSPAADQTPCNAHRARISC